MTGVLIRKEERGSLVSWSPCIPQYAVFLFSTNKLSTNKIFPTSKKKKKEEEEKIMMEYYKQDYGQAILSWLQSVADLHVNENSDYYPQISKKEVGSISSS
jgi:hypothetical protein